MFFLRLSVSLSVYIPICYSFSLYHSTRYCLSVYLIPLICKACVFLYLYSCLISLLTSVSEYLCLCLYSLLLSCLFLSIFMPVSPSPCLGLISLYTSTQVLLSANVSLYLYSCTWVSVTLCLSAHLFVHFCLSQCSCLCK